MWQRPLVLFIPESPETGVGLIGVTMPNASCGMSMVCIGPNGAEKAFWERESVINNKVWGLQYNDVVLTHPIQRQVCSTKPQSKYILTLNGEREIECVCINV